MIEDKELRVAVQTTLTRFEMLAQFRRTDVPCGLCVTYGAVEGCGKCPLATELRSIRTHCLDIVFGEMSSGYCGITFNKFAAKYRNASNYAQVVLRKHYIRGCIEFYSEWLQTGIIPEVQMGWEVKEWRDHYLKSV